jgi:hypothetical protein
MSTSRSDAHHRAGDDPHGGVGDGHCGVAQASAIGALVVGPDGGHGVDLVAGQAVEQGVAVGGEGAPALGGRVDGRAGGDEDHRAHVLAHDLLRLGLHRLDIRGGGDGVSDDDSLDRGPLHGVVHGIVPSRAFGQGQHGREPVLARVDLGCLHLCLQVAGGHAQDIVEIRVGVDRQQRAFVGASAEADEQEVALDVLQLPLQQIEFIDLYCAQRHMRTPGLTVSDVG